MIQPTVHTVNAHHTSSLRLTFGLRAFSVLSLRVVLQRLASDYIKRIYVLIITSVSHVQFVVITRSPKHIVPSVAKSRMLSIAP